MREIKFRAWDSQIMHTVSALEWTQGGLTFYGPGAGRGIVKANPRFDWEVDSTLMQYTGLKDKNGKEVYEGDILQSTCEMVNLMSGKETGKFKTEIYEVRWEEDKGRWGRWRNDKFELLSGLNKAYMLKWYEIIGNIWENGDLLNDEETKQPVKEGG